MELTIDVFKKQMARLAECNELANGVIRNPNRTERLGLVQVNLQHLQRLRPQVQKYESYTPKPNEEFNYARRAADLVEAAEEYAVELQGFLSEIQRTQVVLTSEQPASKIARATII